MHEGHPPLRPVDVARPPVDQQQVVDARAIQRHAELVDAEEPARGEVRLRHVVHGLLVAGAHQGGDQQVAEAPGDREPRLPELDDPGLRPLEVAVLHAGENDAAVRAAIRHEPHHRHLVEPVVGGLRVPHLGALGDDLVQRGPVGRHLLAAHPIEEPHGAVGILRLRQRQAVRVALVLAHVLDKVSAVWCRRRHVCEMARKSIAGVMNTAEARSALLSMTMPRKF
mmetsp:Transcript_35173/g.98773  ORF Transcript_35173/g.98773 Transcript_35173/m.98773 type:complete len:225 (-) Transcript_35173:9-683(-)